MRFTLPDKFSEKFLMKKLSVREIAFYLIHIEYFSKKTNIIVFSCDYLVCM